MNLQLHLLTRIALVAVLCLLLIATFLLYQSHRQAEQNKQRLAEAAGKQLESQLLLMNAGIGRGNPFPDFEFWKQSGNQPGICLAYSALDMQTSRNLCNGTRPAEPAWPNAFEVVYRAVFNPGRPLARSVGLPGKRYGTLTVTPSAELEIAAAWNETLSLMALSGVTVLSVCLLVYLSISRALRPAQIIVAHLKTMESGDLAIRLPAFDLNEWRRIAAAINRLAASQQQLLAERQKLVVKLIDIQEQERRYLARELHDEYGQCLAAINAVASAIKQSAAGQCPGVIDEAEHISRITAHMLSGIQQLLGRLRPAEFDELGLEASLNALVAGWNGRGNGKARYRLNTVGDCAVLSEAQAVGLFRIAQESLTNIAKHAAASNINIDLIIDSKSACLTVKDDGIATHLPHADTNSIGLLGIRERVTALNGQLRLAIAKPHGLILEVRFPLNRMSEPQA